MTCNKNVGRRIWLSGSGESTVSASVDLVGCDGPLSADEFDKLRDKHLYDGPRPYTKTYVWKFEHVECVHPPISISHKHGCVVWQNGPGP